MYRLIDCVKVLMETIKFNQVLTPESQIYTFIREGKQGSTKKLINWV